MKRFRSIVYVCAVVLCVACQPTPEELKTIRVCSSAPEGRACAICFATNGTVFVAGGRIQDGSYSTTMMCYDASSDQWQTIPFPIQARVNGTACVTSNGVYLGLGYAGGNVHIDSVYLHDWWRYEPDTDAWTRLADFPAAETVGAVCWSDDKTIWVAGGFHAFTNAIWQYDISEDRWTQADQSNPARVMSPVAAKCMGRYFFGTGFHEISHNDWREWFEDGHWERRSSVPGKGRHNAACAATEETVWVFGGWHYGDSLTTGFYFDDILRYVPQTDRWTYCGVIPYGTMENGAAAAIGKTVFFGLGEDKNGTNHSEWYAIEE